MCTHVSAPPTLPHTGIGSANAIGCVSTVSDAALTERVERGARDLGDLGIDDRETEIARPRDAQATDVERLD